MINRNRLHHARKRFEKKAFMGMPMPWMMPMPWATPYMTPTRGSTPWGAGGGMASPYAGIFDTATDSGNNLPVQDFSIFEDADPLVERGRNLDFGPWNAVFDRLSAREKAIFWPQLMWLLRRAEYLRETLPAAAARGAYWARQQLREGSDRASETMAEWILNQARASRYYNAMLEKGLSPSEAVKHVAAYMGRDPDDPRDVAAAGVDAATAYAYELYGHDDPRLLELAKSAVHAIRNLGTNTFYQSPPHAQQAARERSLSTLRKAEMILGPESLRELAIRMGIDYDSLPKRQTGTQRQPETSRPSAASQVAVAESAGSTSSLRQSQVDSTDSRYGNYYQRNDPLMARSTGIYPGPSRASKYL